MLEKIILPTGVYSILVRRLEYDQKKKQYAELFKEYLIKNNIPINTPIEMFKPKEEYLFDNDILKSVQLSIDDID